MSALRPHSPADLALAPVLVSIERNLARLRQVEDLELQLAIELNDDERWYQSAQQRAQRVGEVAMRDVHAHGWTVHPTPDLYGLTVSHDGYSVSVMLGKRLTDYVEHGILPGPQAVSR